LAQHGSCKNYSEEALAEQFDTLLRDGVLVRRGQKYPTLWLAGRESHRKKRGSAPGKPRTAYSALLRELDNYRRRTARRLKWKPFMVFHRKVILALAKTHPTTEQELLLIPGLGPAKIQQFGHELLRLVREHAS
jgi:ATP-dependent DNA helicase RecQ